MFLIIDLETCSHTEPLGDTAPLEDIQSKHIKSSIEDKEPRDSMFHLIIFYRGLGRANIIISDCNSNSKEIYA